MLRSEIVRRILEARGIAGEDLEAYLSPSLRGLAAPEDLPGVVEAADVMLSAVAAGGRVVVFGDYDCDGVCATAILVRALNALGAKVSPFLPRRLEEGYGMSDAAVGRMLEAHPDASLVVTVDNGINSVEQVAFLKGRGVGVVVTDHHLPGEELPSADVLVNPKVSAPPSLQGLCGSGVAYFLAHRLVSEAKRRGAYGGPNIGGPLLVMAGLATVTDVMPLLGQNRIFVSEALRRFDRSAPVGLRELHLYAARSGSDRYTARDFSHLIGPRMNAAGRLASGDDALALVLADDREEARGLARKVDERNVQRKAIEQKMTEDALARVVPGAAAQVIDLPEGHQGVAGIVAARVLEHMGGTVPVCVVAAAGHGSARAPDGVNIRDAIAACSEVLHTYGGHAAAAGFSVKEGRIDDFRRMLCAVCAERSQSALAVRDAVDAWIEPSDVTLELAEDLQLMEPFGEGNQEPVFGMRAVAFSDVRLIGADGRHLALTLAGSGLRAVFWGMGAEIEKFRANRAGTYSIRFRVAISSYLDRHVEMHLFSATPERDARMNQFGMAIDKIAAPRS